MTQYNIYYGTIGKKLGVRYRFTKNCKNDADAINTAKEAASSFYYKNEGKCGIPSFNQVMEESRITGVDLEKLYQEHIEDLMRWYAIPTEVDTVPSYKLK